MRCKVHVRFGKEWALRGLLTSWHGKEYNSRGEKQLTGYLDDYGVKIGYMVSFNFNHNKKIGVQEIMVNGKTLIEAVV